MNQGPCRTANKIRWIKIEKSVILLKRLAKGLSAKGMKPKREFRAGLMKDVVAVVLAGGKGSRLEPLTRDRAKPAVPFGGNYRIIDFALSNCLNSGIRRMLVLTQYKAMSLDRHINLAWRHYFCRELGEFIDVVPPQQRIDEHWYQGTADAVYQNIYAIEKERPDYVVVLAGDHIYKMNYRKMVEFHQEMNADLTIGSLRVDVILVASWLNLENRIVALSQTSEFIKSVGVRCGSNRTT